MEDNILQIINIILANRTKNKLASINPGMDLRNDIGFDSLDLAELTVRIEAEYKVDVFENGIINTIGEIMDTLKAK